MTGFIISTLSVLFTAWIVHAATYRAAYVDGQQAERARVEELHRNSVPAGTRPDSYEAKAAHVRRDDEIYGRHG